MTRTDTLITLSSMLCVLLNAGAAEAANQYTNSFNGASGVAQSNVLTLAASESLEHMQKRTQLTKNTVLVRTHNAMENTLQTQLSAHNAALTSRIEARLNQQLSPISVKGNTL